MKRLPLPGPYKAERKARKNGLGDNIKIVAAWVIDGIADDRRLIATINSKNAFAYANAQLLAAAPGLLTACKSALNLLEIMEYSDGADEGELAIMKNIRTAIAQAEGES